MTISYPVASAALSAQSLSFPGSQPQGTVSSPLTLSVTNAGSAPLDVTGVQTAGANAADYLISNGCQPALAPGASCQIDVRFPPQSVVHGTLTLKRGAIARHRLRLKRGSYRLLITTGSGRGTKTLLRLVFRVR